MSNSTDEQAISEEHMAFGQPLSSVPRSDPATRDSVDADNITDEEMPVSLKKLRKKKPLKLQTREKLGMLFSKSRKKFK